MKDIRVNFKFRNNFILSMMEANGITSIAELCSKINESVGEKDTKSRQSSLGLLINMRLAAKKKNGEWIPEALRLANFFKCMPEELFSSPQQQGSLLRNQAEAQLSFYEMQQLTTESPAQPEALLQAKEFRTLIHSLLSELPPRDQRVLKMRFGIDCDEHTLEQISALLNVNRERVRQIELRALRKLKHPANSSKLTKAVCSSEIIKTRWGERKEYIIDQSIMDALRE